MRNTTSLICRFPRNFLALKARSQWILQSLSIIPFTQTNQWSLRLSNSETSFHARKPPSNRFSEVHRPSDRHLVNSDASVTSHWPCLDLVAHTSRQKTQIVLPFREMQLVDGVAFTPWNSIRRRHCSHKNPQIHSRCLIPFAIATSLLLSTDVFLAFTKKRRHTEILSIASKCEPFSPSSSSPGCRPPSAVI